MATEREKIFFETLQRILDSRVRLEKQQKDFDQLSLDLQMRLDAKEFTACEIAESFRAFKKEILEKAEDSRTGQVRKRKREREMQRHNLPTFMHLTFLSH